MAFELAVLTGLPAEAAVLPPSMRSACARCDTARARVLAAELLAGGAEGLVSFGLAGGLSAGAGAGTLVLALAVVTKKGRQACWAEWTNTLAEQLPHARLGVVAAVDGIVASVAEKRLLADRTGAVAVDMESGAVAEVCAAAGKPFIVLRVVADPLHRAIPKAALAMMNGGMAGLAGSLLAAPSQVPELLRLAAEARRALKVLAAAAPALATLRR
jgi:hypothetical protein